MAKKTEEKTRPLSFSIEEGIKQAREAIESGKIKKGDRICLVGFGAGLTYACAIFEY